MAKINRDPIDIQIGTNIRTMRLARRFSLEQLGGGIGVTYQQIQKYETGANRTSAATLIRIAEALETPLAKFLPAGALSEGEGAGTDGRVERVAASLYAIAPDKRDLICAILQGTIRAYNSAMQERPPV